MWHLPRETFDLAIDSLKHRGWLQSSIYIFNFPWEFLFYLQIKVCCSVSRCLTLALLSFFFFYSIWDLSGSWYHEWFVCWLLDILSVAMRLWILLKTSVLVNFFWQHSSSSEVATFLWQVRVESSLSVGLLWHSRVMGLFITNGWGEKSGSWPSCTSLTGRSRSLILITSHWHHLGTA